MTTPVTCARCGKTAAELIPAYVVADHYGDARHTADDYAREDGTYNAASGRFACDACYIALGTPANHVSSGLGNWTVDGAAPPPSCPVCDGPATAAQLDAGYCSSECLVTMLRWARIDRWGPDVDERVV